LNEGENPYVYNFKFKNVNVEGQGVEYVLGTTATMSEKYGEWTQSFKKFHFTAFCRQIKMPFEILSRTF
jgi:hypothetical protein